MATKTEKKERLTFATLSKHLLIYDKKRRPKPVLTPSIPLVQKWQVCEKKISEIYKIGTEIIVSAAFPACLRAVLELQLLYGLRISEVLNIQVSDISPRGHIRIIGTKGSNNRIVIPFKMLHFWQNATEIELPLTNLYSRYWYYRQYKQLGLYAVFGTNSVTSVTHVFRHLSVLNLQSSFSDTSLNQRFIGHKSKKSTKHYEKNIKA